jgi:DNA-binding GntR family transcriptional regulator
VINKTVKKGKLNIQTFKSDPLAGQIAKILTDAILEGTLKGGDRLLEADLQKQFGISRSPIREAFHDLEKKGLVVTQPRKGTVVRTISRRDIEEHFPVRAHLEGLAARMAFSRMTAAEIEQLQKALDGMQKAVANSDPKAYFNSHLRFHEVFIQSCGNTLLQEFLQKLRMHSMWYYFSYQYYLQDLKKSLAIHQELFKLFSTPGSDPEVLQDLVERHIAEAMDRFLEYLEKR